MSRLAGVYKVSIDHNVIFMFGLLYYLISPVIIGLCRLLEGYPGYENWYNDFLNLTDLDFLLYFLWVFLFALSFYLGSMFSAFFRGVKSIKIRCFKYGPGWYGSYTVVLSCCLTFFYLIYDSGVSFSGYKLSYDVVSLGAYATLSLLFLFLYVHFYQAGRGVLSKVALFFLVCLIIVLIGYGSRMYVLIPILTLFFFFLHSGSFYLNLKTFVALAFLAFSFLLIGIWRVGLDFSLKSLFYVLFSEPSFTWWSVSTYLLYNDETYFNPIDYLSSFVNLIPRPLFPGKGGWIVSLSDYVDFDSPLGARSIFVSLVGNFGFFISLIYTFLFSVFLSVIKYLSYSNDFFRYYYSFVLAVLSFSFFRDPFSVTNKVILFNGFFLPLLILFFIYVVYLKRNMKGVVS